MTTFPGSPRLPKGAIVALDASSNVVVSTIAFQYNPEKITRTLNAQTETSDQSSRSEALRLKGAPVETIKFNEVEIDATDQLEKGENIAVTYGIYPQLSALEILIYPKSSDVKTKMDNAGSGNAEIIPYEAPLTLLVWGKNRVLPVRLTEFTINEQAFDVNLNPIRATLALGFRVLSYNDLPWTKRGSNLFFNHHVAKEQLANLANSRNPSVVTGVNVNKLL